MKPSTRFTLGIAALSLVLLAASGCPTFVPIDPPPFQTNSQAFMLDSNGRIVIDVAFNQQVNVSSFVAQQNVVLETEEDPNAEILITPGPTSGEVTITSVLTAGELLEFNPDGFFRLYLLDDPANPIVDVDGDLLDGDADGTPGGDYWVDFLLLG